MVIPTHSKLRARQAGMMIELVVALGLLVGALLPLAYSVAAEKRLARSLYQRALAVEIVDGETEILAAGYWRTFPVGTHDYPITCGSATNLPPGRFVLSISPNQLRLEWRPAVKHHGGPVVREVTIP